MYKQRGIDKFMRSSLKNNILMFINCIFKRIYGKPLLVPVRVKVKTTKKTRALENRENTDMKWTGLFIVMLLTLMTSGCATLSSERNLYVKKSSPKIDFENYERSITPEYHIDIGDVLDVSVWQVAELNQQVIVRPDGKISYPLIGEVKVTGMTPIELAAELKDRLSYYVRDPNVLVGVKEFGGKKVFILGEVETPGVYRYSYEARIIEIVSLAGGYTRDAFIKNTKVIRGGVDDPEVIDIDLAKLIRKGDVKQNIPLESGDIIYIPSSAIATIGYVLDEINSLLNASDTYKRARNVDQVY